MFFFFYLSLSSNHALFQGKIKLGYNIKKSSFSSKLAKTIIFLSKTNLLCQNISKAIYWFKQPSFHGKNIVFRVKNNFWLSKNIF